MSVLNFRVTNPICPKCCTPAKTLFEKSSDTISATCCPSTYVYQNMTYTFRLETIEDILLPLDLLFDFDNKNYDSLIFKYSGVILWDNGEAGRSTSGRNVLRSCEKLGISRDTLSKAEGLIHLSLREYLEKEKPTNQSEIFKKAAYIANGIIANLAFF
jgi:hypothetical protein